MPLGMPLWDGTKEMAESLNREFNAVLDALVDAGMWTGDPPYRGVSAAQQVRMLAQRAGEVAAMQLRAEAAEARLAAVPVDAIGRYYFHSAVFLEENYGQERAAADSDAINEWLIPRL